MVELVAEMRLSIQENTMQDQSFTGCLIGQVDEYMKAFDTQKAEMLSMFDKNDQHWQLKIESCDERLE